MPVADNNISIRTIYNEINATSHGTNAQIGSGVTISSLRTASNAYTDGDGSSPNVKTTPDRFNEWADYTHALSMGTIDYDVRMGTTSVNDRALWGLQQSSDDAEFNQNAHACGGITVWRIHDGSNTYIKAKWFGEATSSAYGQVYDTTATTLVDTTTGTTIITIPVTNVTITATVSYLSGDTVTYPLYGNHLATADDIAGTGAALLVCKGADQADADPGSDDEQESKYHIALSAAKTGYTTTLLNKGITGNGIIVHSQNSASAESGE